MSRQERENMIQFLTKVQGLTEGKLMLMTDEDVEHLYTRAYSLHEKN
ncbi:BH0509 family protein [Halalkalibacter alkalisediminis]|uniref:BH0509 family protein n=1 Tax=Halalkalibacter alkalisediminis TaxID=935616 RepID=A0ABV6NI79_9BACI|nr:BH0509 family protein [Halalkalibacter alkalisediminis]